MQQIAQRRTMRRYAENVIIFVQQRIQRGKHSFLNLPFGFAARITDVKFLGIFPTAADIRPQFVKLGRRNSCLLCTSDAADE